MSKHTFYFILSVSKGCRWLRCFFFSFSLLCFALLTYISVQGLQVTKMFLFFILTFMFCFANLYQWYYAMSGPNQLWVVCLRLGTLHVISYPSSLYLEHSNSRNCEHLLTMYTKVNGTLFLKNVNQGLHITLIHHYMIWNPSKMIEHHIYYSACPRLHRLSCT